MHVNVQPPKDTTAPSDRENKTNRKIKGYLKRQFTITAFQILAKENEIVDGTIWNFDSVEKGALISFKTFMNQQSYEL